MPTRYVQPLTLIVNELILNSLKYAHPAGVPLRLSVACDMKKGALVLTVDDDGVGLPEGFDPNKDGDLGFRVIRSLCEELHAEFDVQSSSLGTSFEIMRPRCCCAGRERAERLKHAAIGLHHTSR